MFNEQTVAYNVTQTLDNCLKLLQNVLKRKLDEKWVIILFVSSFESLWKIVRNLPWDVIISHTKLQDLNYLNTTFVQVLNLINLLSTKDSTFWTMLQLELTHSNLDGKLMKIDFNGVDSENSSDDELLPCIDENTLCSFQKIYCSSIHQLIDQGISLSRNSMFTFEHIKSLLDDACTLILSFGIQQRMPFCQTLELHKMCDVLTCKRDQLQTRQVQGIITVIDDGLSVCLEDILKKCFPHDAIIKEKGRVSCPHNFQTKLYLQSWSPLVVAISLNLAQSIKISKFTDQKILQCVCCHIYLFNVVCLWCRQYKMFQ